MNIELRALKPNESTDVYEMVQEIGAGENGFENRLFQASMALFQAAVQKNYDMSCATDLPEGYVPQTIYWLYVDSRPVGYGKLRHYLNDSLMEHGGHIGYVVRPSERGKGYAKILLKELLMQAQRMTIEAVLLTCNEDNLASRGVIESNCGELTELKNGSCKYWIRLSEKND